MRYVFTAADGSTVEKNLPMEKAPPMFSEIVVDGVLYKRLPQAPEARVKKDRHGVAWSQDPVVNRDGTPTGSWDPDTTPYDKDPSSLSYGLPVFDSWGDIKNLEKQSDGRIKYGD